MRRARGEQNSPIVCVHGGVCVCVNEAPGHNGGGSGEALAIISSDTIYAIRLPVRACTVVVCLPRAVFVLCVLSAEGA